MSLSSWKVLVFLCINAALALKYDPAFVDYNFNTNQTATNPLDYSADWPGHTYNPSPSNWRFPVYTIILDKWLNGDPTNDNANNTVYEYDFYETGLRNGGDIQGVVDSLDYLSGMGVKVRPEYYDSIAEIYSSSVCTFLVLHIKINLGRQINIRRSTTRHSTLTAVL